MERCVSLGCPEVIRLAKQDDCSGAKIPGIENGYAISCIRNWTISPLVREGESVEYTSDCGSVVIRNRQDDQLIGYEISFETALRSNELEALVTGKDLIASGGFNIGTYSNGNSLSCSVGQDDPRFILEAFYRIPKCVSGANHVRVVLPDAQFKVTEIEREGSITFYRYSAQTGITLANSFGDGPYNDFPQDVIDFLASKGDSEYTSGFDFEEEISISGACGFIEVPEDFIIPDTQLGEQFFIVDVVATDGETGDLIIRGLDLGQNAFVAGFNISTDASSFSAYYEIADILTQQQLDDGWAVTALDNDDVLIPNAFLAYQFGQQAYTQITYVEPILAISYDPLVPDNYGEGGYTPDPPVNYQP